MIEVFRFITVRSLVNRYTRRIRRLREPRYLVPFLVSILWFGQAIFRPFAHRGGHAGSILIGMGLVPPDYVAAIQFVAGVAIFLWVSALWLLPSKTAELVFSPAEIHFLFTAPLTRKQIVQYKIARAQIGIFTGALVGALVFGARLFTLEGWARVLAFWLFFAIGYLHGIAASFVRTDLMQAGWSGVRRRAVTLVIVLGLVGAVLVSARGSLGPVANAIAALIGPGSHPSKKGLAELSHLLATAGSTGLAGVILWPFMVLPRLLFAHTADEFLKAGGVGVLILVVHYFWVLRTDASFEEASVEASQRSAARREARLERGRGGGILVKQAKGFLWRLSPTGRPAVAIVWKNLVNLTRVTPVRALIGLAAFVVLITTALIQHAAVRSNLWVGTTWMAGGLAAFASVLGPMFVRNDLREDLFRIDVIRTFPLAGHEVVLAEVLGAWIALAIVQWLLIVFGLFAFAMSRAPDVSGWPADWVVCGAVGAMLVLPAFTLVAETLQNAMVVMFPAWVQLGNSRARGFEASGQRILTLFGVLIAVTVVALPAVASGGLLAWLLLGLLGPWCLLPGAAVAAAWMVLEVVVGCRLLGRMLDRIDPSTSGIEAQEA